MCVAAQTADAYDKLKIVTLVGESVEHMTPWEAMARAHLRPYNVIKVSAQRYQSLPLTVAQGVQMSGSQQGRATSGYVTTADGLLVPGCSIPPRTRRSTSCCYSVYAAGTK